MKTQNIIKELKFDKNGLIPAIIQDVKSGEVLMLGYINEESFLKTLEIGKVHFFSRSRKKLWLKGETSGHFQLLKEVLLDCDNDTVLFKVRQLKRLAIRDTVVAFIERLNLLRGNLKYSRKRFLNRRKSIKDENDKI